MRRLHSAVAGHVLRFVLGVAIGVLPLLVMHGFGRADGKNRPGFDYNAPPHLRDRQVFRVVAFGSSSTFGVGASSARNSYPARLERLLNSNAGGKEPVEVVNRGIGGEDTRDMMRRLPSDILSRKPDLVIWQTGSNDALRHVPVDEFERYIRAGVAAIRQNGIEVMMMEPQWCPQLEQTMTASRYIEVLNRIAADLNVVIIPRYDLMRQWIATGVASANELIGPDHLHSTDRGYELLAQAVFEDVVRRSRRYASDVRATLSATSGPSATLK